MGNVRMSVAVMTILAATFCLELDAYERYWNHYHDSLVYKIFLKGKRPGDPVLTTLDQVTNVVRVVGQLSGGMHQVVYLVGWQHEGHDSRYPSWDSVGRHCASSFSDDPLQSLRAVMTHLRCYNADVSLHVNMNDAYTNSPLWEQYVDADTLCRNGDGKFCRGALWGGERSYRISHYKEWRTGLAQKRISRLLKMIPEIRASATIHIDALFGVRSDYDGIDIREDVDAINNIVDYWHESGIDVTTEFLPSFDQVGYFPAVYHLNIDERARLRFPPSLLCGGDAAWNVRDGADYYRRKDTAFMPQGGCAYEEAWGCGHFGDLTGDSVKDGRFCENLFKNSLLNAYYNKSRPRRHVIEGDEYRVERENGVVSIVEMSTRRLTVRDHQRIVVDDENYVLDFPIDNGVVLAYSRHGCDRWYELPKEFLARKELRGYSYPGQESLVCQVSEGRVRLVLKPNTSVVLR